MVARPDFERSFAEQHDFHSNFPKETEFGIIATDFPGKNLTNMLSESLKKSLPTPGESDLEGAKEVIHVSNVNYNVFNNDKVVKACVKFLTKGKFN